MSINTDAAWSRDKGATLPTRRPLRSEYLDER
jgi:hypothetical protein